MNEMHCSGLDGSNPLHFLAALGVLRLLALKDPAVRAQWIWQGAWRPRFRWDHSMAGADSEVAAAWLADWLRALGSAGDADPKLNRSVGALMAERKKVLKRKKEAAMSAKAASKAEKLAGEALKASQHDVALAFERDLVQLDSQIGGAQQALSDALGAGIAHLGDIIGVVGPLFRAKAKASCLDYAQAPTVAVPRPAHPQLVAESIAAQGSDGVVDNEGRVRPTPFSFSNGASGQCLLKDFRACATASTEVAVLGSLSGQPAICDMTNLNWDPSDQRTYALMWQDPERFPKRTDPAANALAFVGLTLLPALPVGSGIGALGWRRVDDRDQFVWPIWEVAIGLDEVRSLLGIAPTLAGRTDLARIGIAALLVSDRINPNGKRNFFAPSRGI